MVAAIGLNYPVLFGAATLPALAAIVLLQVAVAQPPPPTEAEKAEKLAADRARSAKAGAKSVVKVEVKDPPTASASLS